MKRKAILPRLVIVSMIATALSVAAPPDDETGSQLDAVTGDEWAATTEVPDDNETIEAREEDTAANLAQGFFESAAAHAERNELTEAIADCTQAIELEPDNVDYLSARAEFYGQARQLDSALQEASEIIAADPHNLRMLVLRGQVFELSGDSDSALKNFNAAVQANPNNWQALYERQNYFERQGQHDKALGDADRIIQLQPDLDAGYLSRSITHSAAGEFDQAIDYASAIIQRPPDNWLAYSMRGGSRAANLDLDGASADLEKALELSPDNPVVLSARAMLYFEMGEYAKCVNDLTKASAIYPHEYKFKGELAEVLATCPDDNVRDAKKAAGYAKEALRLAPNDPLVWNSCASAAAEIGDFEEAVKWQRRVMDSKIIPPELKREAQKRLALFESHKPLRDNFAILVREIKTEEEAGRAISSENYDHAIELLSSIINANPTNEPAYRARSSVYYRQQKYDEEIADLTKIIEMNSTDADAYVFRAQAFENLHKYDSALNDLLVVEKLDPNRGWGMSNALAWFFSTCPEAKIRDGNKAAEYIDDAVEKRPDEPAIWDTCAAVFAENGDFDAAIAWEEAALERTDLPEASRGGYEKRLALYKQHQPYRDVPEQNLPTAGASVAPAQSKE